MLITSLEQAGRHRYKVFLDEGFAFILTEQELDLLKLSEGSDISDELYASILEDIVVHRAKQKALDILTASDKSEAELRLKLRQSGYTEEIADIAVAYVKGYRYIDDARYAENYIRSFYDTKSRQTIRNHLLTKGIDAQTIADAFESVEAELEIDTDEAEFKKALSSLKKKLKDDDLSDPAVRRRLEGYLFRQGFRADIVRRAVESEGQD